MRGSIVKRGNSWQLRVYRGQVDGRKSYRTRTFKGGKRAAEAALRDFIAEVEEEEAPPPPPPQRKRKGPTVGDALEAWWTEEGCRLDSAKTARCHLDAYLLPRLADVPLTRLRERTGRPGDTSITTFYLSLTSKEGKPLAPSTVARIHTTFRSAMGHAVRAGTIERNVVAGARRPRVTRRTSTVPDAPEMAAFMSRVAAENPCLHVWLCLVASGARPVEVHALRWSAIDFATGTLELRADGVVRGTGAELRRGETKKRRVRDLALDPYTLWVLANFRARCSAWPDSALIFAKRDGRPLYPTWARQAFMRIKERARMDGLALPEGFRPYDLRHFLGSQAIAAGMPVGDVAYRMGNSPSTVHRAYTHPVGEGDRRIAGLMGELWGNEAKKSEES